MRDLLNSSQIASLSDGKHHDGDGLYLIVKGQARSWVYRYQLRGVRREMGIGSYPAVSLRRARQLRNHYASLRAEGVDPMEERKKSVGASAPRKTIKEHADEFFESYRHALKGEGEAGMWWSPVNNHVLPTFGKQTIHDLTVESLVDGFREVWDNHNPTATKAWQRFRKIVKFAADEGFDLTIFDKARAKLGVSRHKPKSHDALHWEELPARYASLTDNVIDTGLKVLILTTVRAESVAAMQWDEVDLAKALWVIPAERVKAGREFRVPLAWQTVALIRRMPRRTPYVFATPASSGHVASGTWLKKLRTHWGVTVHGKRSTFADWAVENEVCSPATADAVLDHETRKKVTRAYQRYDLLNQRRAILQQWANFVTGREVEMYEDALGLKSELDKT